jgi:hypothetical protein
MKLTRREVATTLRRSIATVRRLEGHVLHPQRDARGTYWFASDEVDRLRAGIHRARPWARSEWFQNRTRTAKDRTARRAPALGAVLEACEALAMTARRGRYASRSEAIVSLEALSDLLDVLTLHT